MQFPIFLQTSCSVLALYRKLRNSTDNNDTSNNNKNNANILQAWSSIYNRRIPVELTHLQRSLSDVFGRSHFDSSLLARGSKAIPESTYGLSQHSGPCQGLPGMRAPRCDQLAMELLVPYMWPQVENLLFLSLLSLRRTAVPFGILALRTMGPGPRWPVDRLPRPWLVKH